MLVLNSVYVRVSGIFKLMMQVDVDGYGESKSTSKIGGGLNGFSGSTSVPVKKVRIISSVIAPDFAETNKQIAFCNKKEIG